MSNNLHRVQNILISDGTALPANNAAPTAVTTGKIGIYGIDMTALNPAGGDTITTQPSIYIMEAKSDGTLKRSMKINGVAVTKYEAESYTPVRRQVEAIGYDRKLATGSIVVAASTEYNFSILFKNYKWLYSERPELFRGQFTSSATATQLTIATQIAGLINTSSYKTEISAVVVGNGTGVYGLTGASNYGIEIWALDVPQNLDTTYTLNRVYFSVALDASSGFSTTTQTTIQTPTFGNGTYNQVYNLENIDYQYEGVLNKRLWPIPTLIYSAVSTPILSAAIVPTVTGTISEDTVTFSATVAAIIRPGELVELGGVNYEIKYFISATVAVLTTVLSAALVAAAAKVRLKYDLINIEFNDVINTPTGVTAIANKSVVIATPAINTGGAFNSLSTNGTDVKAVLDAWMATTPGAFAAISI